MFRTWTIRQGNTVRVRKLTEIVISLWLGIIKLDKEWFNVILLYRSILETNIWNKGKCERVNKSLDSYWPEDYYDINYNKQKINTIVSYCYNKNNQVN